MNDNIIIHATNMIMQEYAPPLEAPLITPVPTAWAARVRRSYRAIRDEYEHFLKISSPAPTQETVGQIIASPDLHHKWMSIPLRVQMIDTPFAKLFPETMRAIQASKASYATISIMEPGAELAAHTGLLKNVLRYHLCLVQDESCHITLERTMQKYVWEEGKDALFDDTLVHSVVHGGQKRRAVLFMDVPRITDIPCLDNLTKVMTTLMTATPKKILSNSVALYGKALLQCVSSEKFFERNGLQLLDTHISTCGAEDPVVMDVGGSGLASLVAAACRGHLRGQPAMPVWSVEPTDAEHLAGLLDRWNLRQGVRIVRSRRSGSHEQAGPLDVLHITRVGEAGASDLAAFLPRVKPGGLVIARDGTCPGVPPGAARDPGGGEAFWIHHPGTGAETPLPEAGPAARLPGAFAADFHHIDSGEVLFPWVDCCVVLTYHRSPRDIRSLLERRPARKVCVLTGPRWRESGCSEPYQAIRESVLQAFALTEQDPAVLVLEDDCVLGDISPKHSESIRAHMARHDCQAYSLGTFILNAKSETGHLKVTKGMSSHAVIYTKTCREQLARMMREYPSVFYDILLYNEVGGAWTGEEPLAVQSLQKTDNQEVGLGTLPAEILEWMGKSGDIDSAWRVYREAHRARPDLCKDGHLLRKMPGWVSWRSNSPTIH